MSKPNPDKAKRRAEMEKRISDRAGVAPPPGYELSAEQWGATHDDVRRYCWRRELELRDAYAKLLGLGKGALDDNGAFEAARAELQYRREVLESVRPFREAAEASGTTLPEACQAYFSMDRMLRADFVSGMLVIFANLGIDPMDAARALQAYVAAPNPPSAQGAMH